MNNSKQIVKGRPPRASGLIAGAATADVTPEDSQFLFGYPHVRRYSTGVHDRLLSSALFLSDGTTPLLLVANDVIYVSRKTAARVRNRIAKKTAVAAANIMITATHTHSGPLTADTLSNEGDPVVPKTDPRYVERLENGIVEAAVQAVSTARPVEIGCGVADGSCVGTNRHDPQGPAIPETPILVVRDAASKAYVAAMAVCAMHPTVLHEDSTLLSGDFPAMTRQHLQEHLLGQHCPVIWHTGPCGNQSPRHVTRANTFDEAKRLGQMLGESIAGTVGSIDYSAKHPLACERVMVDLPRRGFPRVDEAQQQVAAAAQRLEALRQSQADRREIRTAECDWFGSEETLALAKAAAAKRLNAAVASIVPAEIQIMRIGPWSFVGWPGEVFVEFALLVKASHADCHVISMANGELQGYLVTEEAVRGRWYEAMNSLFSSPEAGMVLVNRTLELLRTKQQAHSVCRS
jgi:neutral ceramidase